LLLLDGQIHHDTHVIPMGNYVIGVGNYMIATPSELGNCKIADTEASDAEMFAEINTIAELIGSTASDADSPRGHYSAVRDFGPVQYRAVAIPHSARDNEGGV
jgi:hypothetical protein